ncbi:uncharacterized protein SOCE26_057620 [Sorangium cellulosum]|uniref:Uncharacterized protein n=1 Tax=Sorangium cellulosum TaxID=56 RepID=A0A2L0EYB2_SORCE|nr:hypothetical protein [Sorangium cellulosum]AUX44298.1 uncharacterized protein SOCE26_057620 [Sorangium cellulosum]
MPEPIPVQHREHPPAAPSTDPADGSRASASAAAPPDPSAPAPSSPPSWTASLLAELPPERLRDSLSRFGVGLGLASLYGVALGARRGGVSLVEHAVGVPAAMVAVACLGVPALTIVLTLFNAPLDPPRALSATARAAAATGLALGGLAPAAALFVVTSETRATAAIMALLGLAAGGAIGLRVLLRDLKAALGRDGNVLGRAASGAAFLGFAAFAVALSLRVWLDALPLFNGGAS